MSPRGGNNPVLRRKRGESKEVVPTDYTLQEGIRSEEVVGCSNLTTDGGGGNIITSARSQGIGKRGVWTFKKKGGAIMGGG